ncbi:WD40 repeat-like protein [Neocallimastix lanati (nom. inval.)]|jgi:WD40 repeat protein|uniref:WD40 repeat-like protein n=1 Tax=Neocallimastix californiae TaxID=1754190 RepID=A0A1Y2EZX4_9FUNG|nr:WD40 repeat-like protein [Neocallimastix sp. JGI-2020a]ORY76814.1 WD40 repeat-like protein [Neocallimastix californiae]|eukprot:ORY76814.1 WD40 repeat-like protein [Neocallimastix californiae]
MSTSENVNTDKLILSEQEIKKEEENAGDEENAKDEENIKEDTANNNESNNDNDKSNDKNVPLTTGNLIPRFMRIEQASALAVEFSQNDEFIAVGLSNSVIKIYQASSGALVSSLGYPKINTEGYSVPCTSLSFRNVNDSGKRAKNVLIAGYANGATIHWHITSGQALQMNIEKHNQVNSVFYNKYGSLYCTAGSDFHVRVYDAATTKLLYDMNSGKDGYTSGHSNKIFSVKFHPKDSNILISGGWDNTIQIWDCRVKYSVRSIYGPHICGDALDINNEGNSILSGSYSKESPLQIWDFNTCKLREEVVWATQTKYRSMLYSAHYSHALNPSYFYAGGSNVNEAKIFSLETKNCLGTAYGFEKPVYSTAMSKDEQIFVLADGNNRFYYYSIDPSYLKKEKEEIKEANEAETISHYFDNKR